MTCSLVRRFAAGFAIAALLSVLAAHAQPSASLVVLNGNIITVDASGSIAQAVAIRDGRFVYVGANDGARALIGAATQVLDARGRSVVPGLFETHSARRGRRTRSGGRAVPAVELAGRDPRLGAGEGRAHAARPVDPHHPRRSHAIQGRPFSHARGTRRDAPGSAARVRLELRGHQPGAGAQQPGARGGAHHAIDARPGRRPDCARRRRQSHRRAAQRARAHRRFSAEAADDQPRAAAAGAAARACALLGARHHEHHRTPRGSGNVCAVCRAEAAGPAQCAHDRHDRHRLPGHRQRAAANREPPPAAARGRRLAAGRSAEDQNRWRTALRHGVFARALQRGGLGAVLRSAERHEPRRADDPVCGHRGDLPRRSSRGLAVVRPRRRRCGRGSRARRARGDRPRQPDRARRFNLIHAYLPNPETARRTAKLGAVVDTQPVMYYKDGDALRETLGAPRAARMYGLKEWLKAGVKVAINADHMMGLQPDHALQPFNPFLALYIAVTRKTESGRVHGPEQRVTRKEALRMMTLDAAFLSFDEQQRGSIEVGKLADLAVLTGDYLACSEDEIRKLKVAATVVDGRVVYSQATAGVSAR